MARKSNHSLYILLALLLCMLLVSPYLGLFNLFLPEAEPLLPSSSQTRTSPSNSAPPPAGQDSETGRETQRLKRENQRQKLSEIEQLLD